MSDADVRRQQLWEILRVWLWDPHFKNSRGFPLKSMNRNDIFTAKVIHAFSHLKQWLELKNNMQGDVYRSYYQRNNEGITMHFQPNDGEYTFADQKRLDYALIDQRSGSSRFICAVESEFAYKLSEIEKDFVKLLRISADYKVMIYGIYYPHKTSSMKHHLSVINYFEASLTNYASSVINSSSQTERWLFVGIPYKDDLPNSPADLSIDVRTVDLPNQGPIKLEKADWDIWETSPDLNEWIWSLYPS